MPFLALLLACADTKIPLSTTMPDPVSCAAGEIRVASTGAAYASLGTALADVAEVDRVCLGAGTWSLADSVSCSGSRPAVGARILVVEGAGSDATTLVGGGGMGPGSYCYDLLVDPGEEAGTSQSWSGLTFSNAAVTLLGGDIDITDVHVTHYFGGLRAFRVRGDRFRLEGVRIDDNVVDYGAGFELYGDGTIDDLVVTGNRFDEGYVGEISGAVTWSGGAVSGNVRTADEPGYDFLETWGDVRVADVGFSDNVTNGPILTAHDALALANVTFLGNVTDWRGVLTANGTVTMEGGALRGNQGGNDGADGAVAVYDDGRVELRNVDIQDNAGCGVGIDGTCANAEPGPNATLTCDASGCR